MIPTHNTSLSHSCLLVSLCFFAVNCSIAVELVTELSVRSLARIAEDKFDVADPAVLVVARFSTIDNFRSIIAVYDVCCER